LAEDRIDLVHRLTQGFAVAHGLLPAVAVAALLPLRHETAPRRCPEPLQIDPGEHRAAKCAMWATPSPALIMSSEIAPMMSTAYLTGTGKRKNIKSCCSGKKRAKATSRAYTAPEAPTITAPFPVAP